MKKTISILAIAGFILALAPAAQAAPITIYSAIVSSQHNRGVYNDPIPGSNAALFNGVGLTGTAPNKVHDDAFANQWLSAQNGQPVEEVTILFDLGDIYDVDSMKIWNFYENYAPAVARGVKDLVITYGTTLSGGNIVSPTTVTSVTQFEEAIYPGSGGSITGVTYDFDDGTGTNNARYILFSIGTSWDSPTYPNGDFVGLDEVQFFVPEPATMSLLAIGGIALIRRRRRA